MCSRGLQCASRGRRCWIFTKHPGQSDVRARVRPSGRGARRCAGWRAARHALVAARACARARRRFPRKFVRCSSLSRRLSGRRLRSSVERSRLTKSPRGRGAGGSPHGRRRRDRPLRASADRIKRLQRGDTAAPAGVARGGGRPCHGSGVPREASRARSRRPRCRGRGAAGRGCAASICTRIARRGRRAC